MHVFLIRHGETVDNVAGLYAGSRDSQLTNHGVEQTKRLGQYFVNNGVRFTHVFASPLSRAFKTAEVVVKAQLKDNGKDGFELEVVKRAELLERDFGSFEGKPFNTRTRDGEDDAESKESLAKRVDLFLDDYLLPLLDHQGGKTGDEAVVAVVAHGMLLAHFWRRLLLRIPKNSLTIAPEIAEKRGGVGLEYIGGWSNTGYMELEFKKTEKARDAASPKSSSDPDQNTDQDTLLTPVPPSLEPDEALVAIKQREDEPHVRSKRPRALSEWYVDSVPIITEFCC